MRQECVEHRHRGGEERRRDGRWSPGIGVLRGAEAVRSGRMRWPGLRVTR